MNWVLKRMNRVKAVGKQRPYNTPAPERAGIVLLITLVLLVVLSTLGYTLSVRVAAQRHRDQYVIDYSQARYSCDSAVKYALATLEELEPVLISRPNVPDFSDLFAMSEEDYQELLGQLAEEAGYLDEEEEDKSSESFSDLVRSLDSNDVDDGNDSSDYSDYDPLDSVKIPGPYGPAWPFVTEPVEFELGSATVKIEVEDENAKYPLGWALLEEPEIKREAQAGFETFCEWMGMSRSDIERLEEQLKVVGEIRPFRIDFKPITRAVRTTAPRSSTGTSPTSSSKSGTTRSRTTPLTRIRRKTVSIPQQIAEQSALYARLFHSSILDTETLARPTVISQRRKESVLKYVGTWASMKVNINTAPRHVLETAFIFGGDGDKIADEIIRQRRVQPFENLDELKNSLYRYSSSIKRCEKYITTTSRFFTIRVTAVSGGAKASSVIAVTKDGKKVQRVAVINI